MRVPHKYRELLNDVKTAVVSDAPRRRLSFYVLNLALSLTSLIMTIVNAFTSEFLLLAVTLAYAVLCFINSLLISRNRVNENVLYFVLAAESLALMVFFFVSGVPNGFSALWACLIPSFSLFVLGVKYGMFCSLTELAAIIFLFWTPVGRSLLLYSYTDEFMLRFPFLYFSMFVIALLIELVRKETQNQLESARAQYLFLYRHDALTGLFNRYGIDEYIQNTFAGESAGNAAVILFDIDNFKQLNDAYGHEFGDTVLKAVANVLLPLLCEHCCCCCWGGEEFLVLMQCDHEPEEVAERIRTAVDNTVIMHGDEQVGVTVSVGVCISDAVTGETVHDAIDCADRALYKSKTDGKNRITVYSLDA